MTTIQNINRAIVAGTFTNDELTSIGDAIRFARAQLTQKTKRSVTIGSTVKFTNTKRGLTVFGTVEKIAIKYITVREANPGRLTTGLWRVPANMLEVV
jgi:hypothetical protein